MEIQECPFDDTAINIAASSYRVHILIFLVIEKNVTICVSIMAFDFPLRISTNGQLNLNDHSSDIT